MRVLVAASIAVGVVPLGDAPAGGLRPTATCTEAIPLRAGGAGGNRVVLGAVSVPPMHVGSVGRLPASYSGPWRFFAKWGLGVRAGSPAVVVSVPVAWRSRVAIAWGISVPVGSAVRLASCPGQPRVWNGYPGGFYLRASSACVPLTVSVGHRSTRVRFGVGGRCPGLQLTAAYTRRAI